MPVMTESIAILSPLQRRMAEAWLTRFEENWHDQKLRECMRALPVQSSLRRPLLLAMIERDLSHHWDEGRRLSVEEYLNEFPELGEADELPVELIAAEFKLHQKFGEADLADFAERFPSRIDDLYILLKPSLFDIGSNPETPKIDDATAERRLKLLRAPAEPTSFVTGPERRTRLLRPSHIGRPTVSHDTPPPSGLLQGGFGDSANADMLGPSQTERSEPAKKLDKPPAETLWLDVETIREKRAALNTNGIRQESTAAPIPAELGRYRIERQLGSSGLGSIYEAVDSMLNRRVAIKVQYFSGPDDERRARFHHEARIVAALTHPLLCPVLDIGQADGFDYLVMPLIAGDSLQELMKQRPIWPVRQAVELVQKLAAALDAAHRSGVVHRDLKPSNVLITPSETPVIVGFGQSMSPDHAQRTANANYVAPEQLAGADDLTGPRSDVFSLGAILYQLLTGQLPPVPTPAGLRLSFRADLDAALQDICRQALAANPDQRYPSMLDFAQGLSSYRQTLRQSENDARLSPSVNNTRASGSAVGTEAPPMLGPVNGAASAAFSQMQQLRNLSECNEQLTGPAPRPGTQVRPKPWNWVISGALGVLVLAGSILLVQFVQQDGVVPAVVATPADEKKEAKPEAEVKPPETPEQLVNALKSAPVSERDAVVTRLQQRRDPETADELVKFIASSEWSEATAPKGESRDAAIAALLKVDPLKVPAVLKRSAKSDDKRVRSWTYREIPKRIDADNDSVLRPILLAGLRDSDPTARALVVEQIRLLRNSHDDAVINALVARVGDDLWGEAGNANADGGKKAAIDALDEFAPRRVDGALRLAQTSSNADVRQWAERRKRGRDD